MFDGHFGFAERLFGPPIVFGNHRFYKFCHIDTDDTICIFFKFYLKNVFIIYAQFWGYMYLTAHWEKYQQNKALPCLKLHNMTDRETSYRCDL